MYEKNQIIIYHFDFKYCFVGLLWQFREKGSILVERETECEECKDFILSADISFEDNERWIYLLVRNKNGDIIDLYNFQISLNKEACKSLNRLRNCLQTIRSLVLSL